MSDVFSPNDLPEGWEPRRLKTVAELRTSNVDKNKVEGERPVRLCNYTDVYYSDRIAETDGLMEATATAEEIRRFRLRRGDVLLTKDSETADDIAVPALVARDFDDVLCGYHLAILRPRNGLDGRYLYYALVTDRVGDQFAIGANGITRFGLSQSVIKDAVVPLPPLPKQRAIADFLDRETAKIDTLIEKKQRLLELLDEKRTALITRAVTRGLDPDVPMKDSGVEWIGEIPEHWEVARLSRLVKRYFDYRGLTPRKLDMEWGGEIPAISAVNVRDGYVDLERGVNYGSNDLYNRWMRSGPVQQGDILFTTEAPMGNAALVPDNCRYILSQRVVLFRTREELVYNPFLLQQLRARPFHQRLETDATGSTAEGISRSKLAAVYVCIPPLEEQRHVADRLEFESARADAMIRKTKQAVSLLHEYRTTLVSAVVTGKLDVSRSRDELRKI